MTILSEKVLVNLRQYFKEWRPKTYSFQGKVGDNYRAKSIRKILMNASNKARINKNVTEYILIHFPSFNGHYLH